MTKDDKIRRNLRMHFDLMTEILRNHPDWSRADASHKAFRIIQSLGFEHTEELLREAEMIRRMEVEK
jgi:hypothetical protein